jgi:hypothetical protein
MELQTIFIIVLTILGTIFLLGIVALPFIIAYVRYRMKNPITFLIVFSHKDQTTMCTTELGRELITDAGRVFVTARPFFANSIKRNLGGEIRAEHLHPSIKGGRLFGFVAIKDQIPTPLNIKEKKVHYDAQGIILDKMPATFSLTANLYESGEFWLNALKSNVVLFEKEKTGLQKLLAIGGIVALIVCIIGIIVIIAISLSLAPKYINQVSGNTTPPPAI